jgi:glycosyltransferase involved in cell wall biosynthesis
MRRALAERLAEKDSVLIVEQPISAFRDRELPTFHNRCQYLPGVHGAWYYKPLHFPERVFGLGKILRQLNQRRLRQELNQLLPRGGKRIVCYDSPTQDQLVGRLREDVSIYLAIDDRTITVWGDPIPGEIEAERRLLGKIDKVVCISDPLADIIRSRMPAGRSVPMRVLPNGYDERIFNPEKNYPEPSHLAHVPRPRVLVAGHISERIDWEGIRAAVKVRPEWKWVFVGPTENGVMERINTIDGTIFYHPPIPVKEVPAWITHCNACAVPYRLNSFTIASHPLKAMEYLAMGAPVLGTRIPSLERYDRVIEWVNEGDGESYGIALNELEKQSENREVGVLRRKAVALDSWENRVNQFIQIVGNAVP